MASRRATLVAALASGLALSLSLAGQRLGPRAALAAEAGNPEAAVLLARRGWQSHEAKLVESLRILTRDLNLRLETDILPYEQVRVARSRCGPEVTVVFWFNGPQADSSLAVLRCSSLELRSLSYGNTKERVLASHTLALKLRALLAEGGAQRAKPAEAVAPADARSATSPAPPALREPSPAAAAAAAPPPPAPAPAAPAAPVTAAILSTPEETRIDPTTAPERSGAATVAKVPAPAPAEEPRAVISAGAPFVRLAWVGVGFQEGRLLGQGAEIALGVFLKQRFRLDLEGGWIRFADVRTTASSPSSAADLHLDDLAFHLYAGWLPLQRSSWELAVGPRLGLHVYGAEAASADRHGIVRALSVSLGPCVSIRGAITRYLTWVLEVAVETQIPRRQFALDGVAGADVGWVQGGLTAGLAASL